MSDTSFTYAVAGIRAMEPSLFNAAAIEQLLACATETQCLQLLTEKGWGNPERSQTADEILAYEREKTWETVGSLGVDLHVFDVLSYPKQFHNLKAAIKEVCTEHSTPGIFYDDCEVSGESLMELLRDRAYAELPPLLRSAAQEAYETLLQTRDGQLCDVIVDRACLDAIRDAGKHSREVLVRDYAESTVAVSDIRIAARCIATGKSPEFLDRALAPCDTLDKPALIEAAQEGFEALCAYLSECGYEEAAEALMRSPSAFECWCDDRIIETIRPQLSNPFSAGPLIAYVLARENEIKTVRIILSGKRSGLSDESIRERVRKMYV